LFEEEEEELVEGDKLVIADLLTRCSSQNGT
jgi:hypothetical protein